MCIKHKKNYFMWYATVLGWRISCHNISEVTKTTLSLRIWMVEILCTVLFDRFLLLARAEGQTETQDTERYFCIILFLLFTIQDVKCKSLTWDLKKKVPAILVPIMFNIVKILFSSWSQLQQIHAGKVNWKYRSCISQLQLTIWVLKACLSTPGASAVGSALYQYKLRKHLKEASKKWVTGVRD